MKGIQVLMLIALFAISTCTSHLDESLTEEDKRQIYVAKEYLGHFDDDAKTTTTDPRIQMIVDAKKALNQVNEDLTREMEQLKKDYESKLANAKRLNSIFRNEETFEQVQLSLDEEFVKYAQSAIENADRNSNQVFLEAYKRLF